ncbi:MAG: hypothetical protein LBI26_03305 [Holosporales bacterium]|jgi:hypothetical protein|nr:hypothetical protein [Holosporales bacterium]
MALLNLLWRALFKRWILVLCFSAFSLSAQNYSVIIPGYLKNLKYLSTKIIQRNSNGTEYNGSMYISRENASNNIRVFYDNDLQPSILINDKDILVIDQKTKKTNSYSIKETPIYDILNGNINLAKEKYSIDNSDKNYVRLIITRIVPLGTIDITLMFSKYSNGNIKYFEGWVIKELNGDEVAVGFLTDSLSINDKKKIPPNIFIK